MIQLPARLRAVAERIPPGARVADIGTDHARLPVWLVQNGRAENVIATDIRPKPLERARRLVGLCGLDGRIRLVLADGLNGFTPAMADTVVMAGMGGDSIAALLRAAPPLPGALFLLQPMTHAERLRAFLAEAGYVLETETLAREGRRLYCILAARPGGTARSLLPAEEYVSRALREAGGSLFAEYLSRQIARLRAETRALEHSRKPGDAERLQKARAALAGLEETEKNERSGRT